MVFSIVGGPGTEKIAQLNEETPQITAATQRSERHDKSLVGPKDVRS
jgi:hypothetical protein